MQRVAVEHPQLRLPGRVERERPAVGDAQRAPAGGGDRRAVERLAVAVEEVDDARVRDDDALRLAGRARRVDDVGGVLGPRGDARDGAAAAAIQSKPSSDERRRRADTEQRGQRVRGDRQRGAGVGERTGDALRRVARVQRQVRAASPHDRQQAHDEVDAARQQQRDDPLGPDAARGELRGQRRRRARRPARSSARRRRRRAPWRPGCARPARRRARGSCPPARPEARCTTPAPPAHARRARADPAARSGRPGPRTPLPAGARSARRGRVRSPRRRGRCCTRRGRRGRRRRAARARRRRGRTSRRRRRRAPAGRRGRRGRSSAPASAGTRA